MVEETLRVSFREVEEKIELLAHMWEHLSPRLGEQRRARRRLPLPFGLVSLTPWGKRYRALVSIVAVIVLAGTLFVFRSSGDGTLSPATTLAAAFHNLRTLGSVNIVVDEYRSRHSWRLWADAADLEGLSVQADITGGPGWLVKIIGGEWTEAECVQDGTLRECVVKDNATGRRVGVSETRGGRGTAMDAMVVFNHIPGFEHSQPDNDPDKDRPPPLNEGFHEVPEFLSRTFLHLGSVISWSLSGLFAQSIEGVPAVPSLLDEFDSVERLAETNMKGVQVEHYRAERGFDEGGSEVVELWLGTEDRLPRKLTRNGEWVSDRPDAHSWDGTYTFRNIKMRAP